MPFGASRFSKFFDFTFLTALIVPYSPLYVQVWALILCLLSIRYIEYLQRNWILEACLPFLLWLGFFLPFEVSFFYECQVYCSRSRWCITMIGSIQSLSNRFHAKLSSNSSNRMISWSFIFKFPIWNFLLGYLSPKEISSCSSASSLFCSYFTHSSMVTIGHEEVASSCLSWIEVAQHDLIFLDFSHSMSCMRLHL